MQSEEPVPSACSQTEVRLIVPDISVGVLGVAPQYGECPVGVDVEAFHQDAGCLANESAGVDGLYQAGLLACRRHGYRRVLGEDVRDGLVHVVSFTHFLQGPSASQLLADLGAGVIKIEPPSGAFERFWSVPDAYLNDVSVFFLLANRNVRSFAIDLKAPQSQSVLDDLVLTADVVIESFRPGVMARLGLGPDSHSHERRRLGAVNTSRD